mmetsp:Transcript_10699/g.18264  ORF Transcript_10699/g.18264 Transcript_10699/m.18264 type:complete len:1056 (+) Transcript_10699:111-3278(+)
MSNSNDLLDLFLRINEATLDFLTLHDFYQLRSISKRTFSALKTVEYTRCRDGCDYAVPFPAYPGILCTESDRKLGAGLFTHQLASLAAMHKAENNSVTFGSLRGGILGDAPGLGKTITMLSLIVNTAGLRPVEPKEFYDKQTIDEHWKLMRVNPVFRTEILKSIKPLRESSSYDELARFVSPPYTDDRFPTLPSFERHVNRNMANKVPRAQLELFRRNVINFKAGLDKRNRRFFCNEKGRRIVFERNLVPCSTTLIIVPDALLEHWAEQIRRHVKLDVFGDFPGSDAGVVYIDGVGDLSSARFPLNHRSMELPSLFELVNYLMVVVPFSRIKQQYYLRKRRRKEDVDDVTGGENGTESSPLLQMRWFRIVVDEGHELGENEAGNDITAFINVLAAERRWVMSGTPTTGDEDSKGFNDVGLTQLQRLLLFLRHEEYGTTKVETLETQSSGSSSGRKQGKAKAKSEWDTMVKIPFLNQQDAGREELFRVLREVMVMHKKEDIGLPKPVFKQGEVTVHIPQEVGSHIVNAVKTGGIFTDTYEKLTIGHRESYHEDPNSSESDRQIQRLIRQRRIHLLKEKISHAQKLGAKTFFDTLLNEHIATTDFQSKVDTCQGEYIENAIKRERKELEGRGGAIADLNSGPLTAASDHFSAKTFIDRRPVKAVVYSSSSSNLLDVLEYFYDKFDNANIAEMMQGNIDVMAYELGRFRLGQKEGKFCPICNGWNEYSGKELSGCKNTLLEVSDAAGNVFLIESERILRAIGKEDRDRADCVGNPVEMNRLGEAPLNKYGISKKAWKVGDALCIDARDPHPLFRARLSEEQWAAYGSARCKELVAIDGGEGVDNYFGPLPCEEETNYGQLMVSLRKWQPCGKFHGKPRWNHLRKKQVGWYTGPTLVHEEIETVKEDVFILALDASLAHGLDLSFVTHLYLLEPIDDAALLEQVTSRAHRLGATGPVTIETVNVWHELDPSTKKFRKQIASNLNDEDQKRTSTAICEHCYRSFDNITLAEEHEIRCDRNPDSSAEVPLFHLSSVYRDLRPPPPMGIGACGDVESDTKCP